MSKGKIIIISCIIVFLGLVSFLGFYVYHQKTKYLYLFTGNTEMVRWYYNEDTWYFVNNNKQLSEKFDVYTNGNLVGSYNLVYNNRWYFFDDNNKSIQTQNDFMINTNYEFKSFKFQKNKIMNQDIIDKLNKSFSIDNNVYDITLNEIVFEDSDINTIYVASFKEITRDYEVIGPKYTGVFTYKNGKINFIKKIDFSKDNSGPSCYLDLEGVFTFENKNIKILLSCQHYDEVPSDYYLLEKKWNKYETIVDSLGGNI